jgi:hypothetical protein
MLARLQIQSLVTTKLVSTIHSMAKFVGEYIHHLGITTLCTFADGIGPLPTSCCRELGADYKTTWMTWPILCQRHVWYVMSACGGGSCSRIIPHCWVRAGCFCDRCARAYFWRCPSKVPLKRSHILRSRPFYCTSDHEFGHGLVSWWIIYRSIVDLRKSKTRQPTEWKCDCGYLPAFPRTELGYAVHSSAAAAH